MKKTVWLVLAVAFVSSAHADTLFNNLGGSFDIGWFDVDGGSNDGLNHGGQVAQVITNTHDTAITGIEEEFVGYGQTSEATGILAEVYQLNGGGADSLVASQTVTSYSEQDRPVSSGPLNGDNGYDISTSVDLAGLQTGQQYLVVLQLQTANLSFAGLSQNGNPDAYVRDFSSFGYAGVYGTASWAELGAYKGDPTQSGDLLMKVTGAATPEPATMAALGLGVLGLVRRRRVR
jgi:hypothetical protein